MGNASDFFRAYQPLFEAKEDGKKGKKPEWLTKVEKDAEEKEGKKPKNVEETSANFFRKYSDIIAEAEACDEEVEDESKESDKKGKKPEWLTKAEKKAEKKEGKKEE